MPSPQNQPPEQSSKKIVFTNSAPEDKEWTAHINLLNEYTTPDRYLRDIIQYARGGKFYPADMHVDLIKQFIDSEVHQAKQSLADSICSNSTPHFNSLNGGKDTFEIEKQKLWELASSEAEKRRYE
jgi:hypothetical protein